MAILTPTRTMRNSVQQKCKNRISCGTYFRRLNRKNVYEHTISKSGKFKHVVTKHFSGAKVDDMKHCMKPTQKKSPAQIIFHIDLVTNKDFNEIANKIVQLAKSAKTDKNKVAISCLVPRKDKLNAKAK